MKRLIIFVDLFSLLTVALFVAFSVSVGGGGIDDESANLVVFELRPQLKVAGENPVSAGGSLDYEMRIIPSGGNSAIPATIITQDLGDTKRYIIRNPPDLGRVKVVITRIGISAFEFDRHRVGLTRIYPSTAVKIGEWESMGNAGEYEMDIK